MPVRPKRPVVIGVAAVLAVLVAGAGSLAYRFLGADEPAEAALTSPSPSASVTGSSTPVDDPGFDGAWSIDVQTGSIRDGSASFAGYRIEEELGGVGANTAVGRTQGVAGSLSIAGTDVTALDVTVDMTTLTSDDERRDDQLAARGLETDTFPTATFALTEPITIGEAPTIGEAISSAATGDLTLHGVTRPVDVAIQAQWTGTHIEVVGRLEVALADYDIEPPVGFLVLSIADTGTIELHLLFAQG